MRDHFYVYLITNNARTVIYTGVTNDLRRRVSEHKLGLCKGFTLRYHCVNLVYYETCFDPRSAIRREKQIKGGSRAAKILLIEKSNPEWNDLSLRL